MVEDLALLSDHEIVVVGITVALAIVTLVFELRGIIVVYKKGVLKQRKIHEYLSYILMLVTFVSAVAINSYDTPQTEYVDVSIRIDEIANTLSDASNSLSGIQEELENRIQYVEELKKEAEIAEEIISLSEEQVAAIRINLKEELEIEGKRSLFHGILQDSFFFILGFLPTIVRWIKRKILKKRGVGTNTEIIDKYSFEQIETAIKLLETLDQKKNN